VQKCGIDACSFDVILESEEEHKHSHKCCGNHGHEHHENDNGHTHEHHEHSHDHHDHEHGHSHGHEHEHRNIQDVTKIIDASPLNDNVKKISKDIFGYVARAEAIAHGLDINEVHFHEVGAVDSIVDIIAVAVCIDNLDITKVCVSTIYEGQGYVKCQHGVIPVPVPAVVNIAQEGAMSIRITENRGEMITPTGMAIATALKTEEKLPESYVIKKIGIGAGKKEFRNANILRALIIETQKDENEIYLLETNIDDCTGEALSYAMERLLEKGANDVFFTPIFMKKNRPATMLSVMCKAEDMDTLEEVIFRNLSTIGIRKSKCLRSVLDRKMEVIKTSLGEITFKICSYKGKKYAYPEYEDVKNLCLKENFDFDTTYALLKAEVTKFV
ncbi:MAG: nickel pincer cofactor biosynthesis protein LarC, partial [Clostridia bacterium]